MPSESKIDRMLETPGVYLITSNVRPGVAVSVFVDQFGNATALEPGERLDRTRWLGERTFEIRGPLTPSTPEI